MKLKKCSHSPKWGRGADAPPSGRPATPPFWGQKIFFPVSFFRKLIVHRFLCLKLFCSSKIVDFRAYFVKISVAQAFFTFGLPHFYNLIPFLAPSELYKCKCPSVVSFYFFLMINIVNCWDQYS